MNTNDIKLDEGTTDEVEEFTYLCSKVNTTGGSENDIKTRIRQEQHSTS